MESGSHNKFSFRSYHVLPRSNSFMAWPSVPSCSSSQWYMAIELLIPYMLILNSPRWRAWHCNTLRGHLWSTSSSLFDIGPQWYTPRAPGHKSVINTSRVQLCTITFTSREPTTHYICEYRHCQSKTLKQIPLWIHNHLGSRTRNTNHEHEQASRVPYSHWEPTRNRRQLCWSSSRRSQQCRSWSNRPHHHR